MLVTCSASKAASGSPASSCRPRSASPSTPAIRHIEFLDAEIAAVERLIAQQALAWPEIRRLMTVPGVNLICAASFIAAVGDADRFLTSRKLVAYLGLDPKVRQSGEAPARSRAGSPSAARRQRGGRWSRRPGASVLQPGPLRAFYERTRARRGHGKAIVATARKLAVLFWCMLTRDEDYAHQQPSLTRKKLRRLELTAGAPEEHHAARPGSGPPTDAIRTPSANSPAKPKPPTSGWSKTSRPDAPARKAGASATPERA